MTGERLTPADVVQGGGEASILPTVRALYSGAWVVGPAATCVCAPADNLALHQALATAPAGSVLVCDAGGRLDGGYLGELMATDALNRGLLGLVISGSVRDTRQLEELAFPVFCLGTCIPSCQKSRAVSVGEPITIDGVAVAPGDQIVADADGVVVVPRAAWAAASAAGREVQKREAGVAAQLADGNRLADLLSLSFG